MCEPGKLVKVQCPVFLFRSSHISAFCLVCSFYLVCSRFPWGKQVFIISSTVCTNNTGISKLLLSGNDGNPPEIKVRRRQPRIYLSSRPFCTVFYSYGLLWSELCSVKIIRLRVDLFDFFPQPFCREQFFFFKDFIYFLRAGKGGRKRGRETSVCDWLTHTPNWGLGPPPRHVSWLGIEPATLWFTGQHSVHWATPARALGNYF